MIMEIFKKRTLVMVLVAFTLTTSCKKTVTVETAEEELTIPPEESTEPMSLLPVKIATDQSEMRFSYKGKLLTKIEYGSDSSRVLSLNLKNQPYTMELVKGKTIVRYSEYAVDANNLVVKILHFKGEPDNEYIGYTTLLYDIKQRLTSIKKFDLKNKLLNENLRTYDSSGNLLTETSTSPGQTITNTYDTKNAIFKQLQYNDLFSIDTNNKLFASFANNIKSSTGYLKATENASYNYVYNKQDYPSKMDIVINKVKTAYAVTYE